jgi:ubiquinol-cytochrome c reductase cytochrome b subunit
VSAGTQPDWYIGFVYGALRLMPGVIGNFHFEYVIFGYTLTLNVLLPALVPAGILFTVMFMYPWIERWITKDDREHHVLDRPRNAPTRTAIGVAGFVWYSVMWAAAGSDLIATHFHVSLNDVTYWLRALFFIGPIIAYIVTKRVALALQRKDREIALHGRETGRIVRLPHGEFIEVHAPLDEYKRYKLVGFESPAPLPAVPNEHGIVTRKEKRRAFLSKWFFEDRVAPATPAELEAAHGHHAPAVEAAEGSKSLSH